MRTSRTLARVSVMLLLAAWSSAFAAVPDRPLRVAVVGDGHTADNPACPGSAGWGAALGALLKPGVVFTNLAPARIPAAGFADGGLDRLRAFRPDVLLIGFSDGPTNDLGRGLAALIAACAGAHIAPILVTPAVTRTVDPVSGKPDAAPAYTPASDSAAEIIAGVAREQRVPLLDLHAWTRKTFAEIGDRACFFLHPPRDPAALDRTNIRLGKTWVRPADRNPSCYSASGADTLAQWLTLKLRALETPLRDALRPLDGPPSADYALVWRDEFEGRAWSTNDWRCEKGPRKDGYNDPAAVALDGKGHLVFTIARTNAHIQAAILKTDPAHQWTYGYFECRTTLVREPGMWNAFWLMGNHVADPDRGRGAVDDTARNGTEIDVVEYLCNQGDVLHLNLHWNGYGESHKSSPWDAFVPDLRQQPWHVVGVEWRPDGYTFFVDGRRMWQTADAISQAPEHLILSVEIGKWAGDIATAKLPHELQVDWVRVWQKAVPHDPGPR